jgi:IS5 family transposase
MTRREKSLEEIDRIMPWADLKSLISWHYPKAGNGRPWVGLRIILYIFFLQHWPNLSDPATEGVLYDSPALIWERESGLRSAGREYHSDS